MRVYRLGRLTILAKYRKPRKCSACKTYRQIVFRLTVKDIDCHVCAGCHMFQWYPVGCVLCPSEYEHLHIPPGCTFGYGEGFLPLPYTEHNVYGCTVTSGMFVFGCDESYNTIDACPSRHEYRDTDLRWYETFSSHTKRSCLVGMVKSRVTLVPKQYTNASHDILSSYPLAAAMTIASLPRSFVPYPDVPSMCDPSVGAVK